MIIRYSKSNYPVQIKSINSMMQKVSYAWQESNSLKISVVRDNESVTFSFNENSMGTSLEVTEETQY